MILKIIECVLIALIVAIMVGAAYWIGFKNGIRRMAAEVVKIIDQFEKDKK